jgi:hypothetical protein
LVKVLSLQGHNGLQKLFQKDSAGF